MIKRLFDIFSALIGTIILLPVFLILGILVKLSSRGPILYKQIRVGLNSRDFGLLKFRTMYIDADSKGLLTVGSRDPRVTPIGFYLRKYKLDELPQLFNVLLGDMSIVGPRPEVRKYVNLYTEKQLNVLSVKPGITDFASIQFSNESDMLAASDDPESLYIREIMPQKLKLNNQYVQQNSLFLDIKLIFLTIRKIIAK